MPPSSVVEVEVVDVVVAVMTAAIVAVVEVVDARIAVIVDVGAHAHAAAGEFIMRDPIC